MYTYFALYPVTRLTPLCMSPWLISWHCAVYCGCGVTTGCGYTHQDHPDTSQRGAAHCMHCSAAGHRGNWA